MKRLMAIPLMCALSMPLKASADPVSTAIGVVLTAKVIELYARAIKCYFEKGTTEIPVCEGQELEQKLDQLPEDPSHEEIRMVRRHVQENAGPYSQIYEETSGAVIPFLKAYFASAKHIKGISASYDKALAAGPVAPPRDLVGLSLIWRNEDPKFANWKDCAERITQSTPEQLARDLFITDIWIWK